MKNTEKFLEKKIKEQRLGGPVGECKRSKADLTGVSEGEERQRKRI